MHTFNIVCKIFLLCKLHLTYVTSSGGSSSEGRKLSLKKWCRGVLYNLLVPGATVLPLSIVIYQI